MVLSNKVILGAVEIKIGRQSELAFGYLDAIVAWGYAPEYVQAFIRMLESKDAHDYIIATGEGHSVKEFVQTAFEWLDLDWKNYVRVDDNIIQKDRRC